MNYDLDQSTDQLLSNLPKGISIRHINVCSIMNKLDKLRIILRKQTFDVFGITESKPDNSIDDSEIQIKI